MHLACSHVKTSRCLRTASVNAVSNAVPAILILIQTRITSFLNATASSAFETAEFEVFRPTHARGSLPRQFSVSVLVTSSFSILEGLPLKGIVKGILPPVGLTVGPNQMPRVLGTNGDLCFGGVLAWRSHKSYLFSNPGVLDRVLFFTSAPATIIHLGGHQIVIFGGVLHVLLFYPPPTLLTFYPALLWGSHWPGGAKSCCLLLF